MPLILYTESIPQFPGDNTLNFVFTNFSATLCKPFTYDLHDPRTLSCSYSYSLRSCHTFILISWSYFKNRTESRTIMTKFMSKSNNCNQSAIIFRIILCSGISLVLGAVLGHLLRTELFADINAEFEQILLALDTKSIHYPSLFRLCTSTQFKQLFLLCFFHWPMHGFSIWRSIVSIPAFAADFCSHLPNS